MKQTEKQLPQNIEAEANTLGSIVIDPERLVEVLDILRPEDFYLNAHRTVYAAMCDLWRLHQPLDVSLLTDYLARTGKLESIGGGSFLTELAMRVPTSRNAVRYARIVERTATLRRLIEAAGEIAAVAYEDGADLDEAISTAHIVLNNATLRHGGNDSATFSETVDAFLSECEATIDSGVVPGVLTGLTALDDHLLGFKPGDLVYLCGRPGSGKSTYAAALAAHEADVAAQRGEGGVEWVSLEMSNIQQAKRLITSWAHINGRIIRAGFRRPDGSIDLAAYNAIKASAEQLKAQYGRTLRLYDKPMTMKSLRQHLTRAVYKRGCSLAILDYLGLMDSEDEKARESDYQRVTAMSRQLKRLAMELHIPIICLVQLNRETEKRANKRPMLSDLRDSGGLEQDADCVIGVYRGALYNAKLANLDDHFRQFAELLVLKAREGVPNVSIPTRFESEYTRPSDWPDEWGYESYMKDEPEASEWKGNVA